MKVGFSYEKKLKFSVRNALIITRCAQNLD